ncbi:F0F1 ATP synthase subunit alpha [Candidatus Azambacteria bacterium]|nr:F0F1 ATP synthase subunit alpha [Candidatus Azambacteria bacterium]
MKEAKAIIEKIKKEIGAFEEGTTVQKTGVVTEVRDGIARIAGLSECMASEMVGFPGDTWGVAMNLEENEIGAIILGDFAHIKEGDRVTASGKVLEVPAGEKFVGRVVDPLGKPLDGRGAIPADATMVVEKIAPGVITRKSVKTPLKTGIKAIDAMVPVGRGQRELIIGDRQTGKTTIAIDAILNQKGDNVVCVYCAVGQKDSKVAKIVRLFEQHGAMDYTIVVNASASSSAALQYLAPYAATAMGEYFMAQGKDVLVVYDDLSKHAWAYRQISLLLRCPPGREAYPGDVFYLHSRLLERAACLSKEHGGGSLTALPIIETQGGDVSAYIPTNVISITDGQIYLDTDMFYAGMRPAINAGLSVSRVGSSAQTKAMKSVAGKMRLELAQYWELAAFAQFEADLDEQTKMRLERGKRLVELLKQDQNEPMPTEEQVLAIFAVTSGLTDDIAPAKVRKFEKDLLQFAQTVHPDVFGKIAAAEKISGDIEAELRSMIGEFKKREH